MEWSWKESDTDHAHSPVDVRLGGEVLLELSEIGSHFELFIGVV